MISLIINAEDFGLSKVYNEVILDLAEKGLITSCNVMADYVDETQGAQVAHLKKLVDKKKISAGLHLVFPNEVFNESDMQRQWDVFVEKLGFAPQHVDVHKVSQIEESREPLARFAAKHDVPSRNSGAHFSFAKMPDTERYHATNKSIEEMKEWVDGLEGGAHEILFHPGKYDPDCKSSMNKERENDITRIEVLNEYLVDKDIKKISYSELI